MHCRAGQRQLVTQVRVLKWWNLAQTGMVGLRVAVYWLARSKLRVGLCELGESLAQPISKEEGIASGWLHRAANTSRSQQWKDNSPGHPRSNIALSAELTWTIIFFIYILDGWCFIFLVLYFTFSWPSFFLFIFLMLYFSCIIYFLGALIFFHCLRDVLNLKIL